MNARARILVPLVAEQKRLLAPLFRQVRPGGGVFAQLWKDGMHVRLLSPEEGRAIADVTVPGETQVCSSAVQAYTAGVLDDTKASAVATVPPDGKMRLTARFEIKREDLWVGVFWKTTVGNPVGSRAHATTDIWICLLPCLPLHLTFQRVVSVSDVVASRQAMDGITVSARGVHLPPNS